MECWQNLGFTDPGRLVELARASEELGFTGVSLPEHLVTPQTVRTPNPFLADGATGWAVDTPFPDPFVTFGALGAVTASLRFLTNVLVLPLRDLAVVARAVSTVAELTGDRLVVGMGVGWLREEFEAVGASFLDRGSWADEMLALLPGLAGRPVPVLVGGITDVALARAARADGWIGVNFTVDALLPILDRLAVARRVAGTSGRAFSIVVSRPPECDAGTVARLADAGVTGLVNRPTSMTVGADAPLDDHRAAMTDFRHMVEAR